jgi:hypothetical protein
VFLFLEEVNGRHVLKYLVLMCVAIEEKSFRAVFACVSQEIIRPERLAVPNPHIFRLSFQGKSVIIKPFFCSVISSGKIKPE